MDKELLIKLQKDKSYKMLADADEMVIQRRWDIAANRYYYACYHIWSIFLYTRKLEKVYQTYTNSDFVV